MDRQARAHRTPLAVVAVACVVPAAVFFGAAVGRSLQPVEREPARTLQAIVDWFAALGDPALLALLVALPAVGTLLGIGLVVASLREDVALRSDLLALGAAVAVVLRRPAFVLGLLTVACGIAFFAVMAVHAIAG